MMENTDWATVKGNSQAPYINSLLPQYAHTENYVSPMHPSLPNYITLEAGANLGLTNGSWLPRGHSVSTKDHLTTYLNRAGFGWKYYAENLPGNGAICNLSDPGKPYSEDHNAFAYFQDVSGNPPSTSSQYCIRHERPYTEFASDLQNNNVPNYSFIVPNDYDQGEKLAPSSSCLLCQADAWLKNEIPNIQASAAYQSGVILNSLG